MVYKIGDIVEGSVSGIQAYGAFIEFAQGYSGLLHISEISSAFIKDVNMHLKIGDKIKTKIIDVDETSKQLRVTIKVFEKKRRLHHNQAMPCAILGSKLLLQKLDYWIENKGAWYD